MILTPERLNNFSSVASPLPALRGEGATALIMGAPEGLRGRSYMHVVVVAGDDGLILAAHRVIDDILQLVAGDVNHRGEADNHRQQDNEDVHLIRTDQQREEALMERKGPRT